jgi:hypothetical protein
MPITKEQIAALPTATWSREQYDAHKPALNQSGCKAILHSPGHYLAELTNPRKDTAALRIGRLTHMAALQPDEFAALVICEPEDAPKRPTEKQAAAKKPKPEHIEALQFWQAFDSQAAGKIVADREEYLESVAYARALTDELKHWAVKPIATELCLTADYGATPLKSQIDLIGADGFIYDLKTFTGYATPQNILREVYARGYHLQAAFYQLIYKLVFGERPAGFRLVFVEKANPYATATFELSRELIAEGGVLLQQAIEAYNAARELNHYPLYPKQIVNLQPRGSQGSGGLDNVTFA